MAVEVADEVRDSAGPRRAEARPAEAGRTAAGTIARPAAKPAASRSAFLLEVQRRRVGLSRRTARVAIEVFNRLTDDDGWAMASHMAMAALSALFPFLIFVAALAGTLVPAGKVSDMVRLMFEVWPPAVAAPIADEVRKVLGASQPGLLTIGAVLAFFLASNGVEAVRVGLNRAYRVRETRPFWVLRLQSILFVGVAATALITLAVLVVLWPVLWAEAVSWAPVLHTVGDIAATLRVTVATIVIGGAVMLIHCYLPAGGRSPREVWPGALATFVIWLGGSAIFSLYIADFGNYARTYAGLGGVMAALFFLWLVSLVFLIGAEINATLLDMARGRAQPVPAGLPAAGRRPERP